MDDLIVYKKQMICIPMWYQSLNRVKKLLIERLMLLWFIEIGCLENESLKKY